MNCNQARENLPALIYGELPIEEASLLESHLRECSACQRERKLLGQVQSILGRAGHEASPAIDVDVPQLYARLTAEKQRSLGRWRWGAWAASAAAVAAILLAVAARFEIKVEKHQVVLRWGSLPSSGPEPLGPAPRANQIPEVKVPASPNKDLENQLRTLSELVQGLALDLDSSERKKEEFVARIESQLAELRQQSAQRWNSTERDLAALAAGQLEPRKERN